METSEPDMSRIVENDVPLDRIKRSDWDNLPPEVLHVVRKRVLEMQDVFFRNLLDSDKVSSAKKLPFVFKDGVADAPISVCYKKPVEYITLNFIVTKDGVRFETCSGNS